MHFPSIAHIPNNNSIFICNLFSVSNLLCTIFKTQNNAHIYRVEYFKLEFISIITRQKEIFQYSAGKICMLQKLSIIICTDTTLSNVRALTSVLNGFEVLYWDFSRRKSLKKIPLQQYSLVDNDLLSSFD